MNVSVLTPSFNQASWLTDNLDSVRNQTFGDIEHIVMDGGSGDSSVDILRNSADVIWESSPDRGQSDALNKAFRRSTGEIIGWLNSDDAYVDRRSVEKAVEMFQQFPDVGVVYGHGLLVSKSNRVMQYLRSPRNAQQLLPLQTFFVQPSVFIRRSVLSDPMVDESLHYVMDRDLWWRLAKSTRFMQLDLLVGLDRFQPARKTLTEGYPREVAMYEALHGVDTRSPRRLLARKALKVATRWSGAVPALRAPREIEPAIDLVFPSSFMRLANQTVLPRRMMDAE